MLQSLLTNIKIFAVTLNCPPNQNCSVTSTGGFADPNTWTLGSVVTKGVNVFSFVIGSISIIMVLVGALRYVLSAGNPQATKEAKDTILYAVIGLVLTILSVSIIKFVTGQF